MHPRNLHLYFFSPTGGTQRVAGLFAENLNAGAQATTLPEGAPPPYTADRIAESQSGHGLHPHL